MDLRSFSETKQEQPKNDNSNSMSEKDVRRAINHFSKMSDDQLMRELGKHLTKKKSQGKQSDVLNIIEQIKPLLNDEQRRRLIQIMETFN